MGIAVFSATGDIVSKMSLFKKDLSLGRRVNFKMIQKHNWYNKSTRYLMKRKIRLNFLKYKNKS